MRATADDLRWWMSIAAKLDYSWASTYADHTPHWYLARERTKMLSLDDYYRALSVIWTYGRPEQFNGRVNVYLHDFRSNRKWFATGASLANRYEVALINMAQGDVYYGEQAITGFDTATHVDLFDQFALEYDEWHAPATLSKHWVKIVSDRANGDLLDLGAGTGFAIDAKLVRPRAELYTAVDSSRGMLNALALKHSWVRDFRNEEIDSFLASNERGYDTVVALNGSASYLTPADVSEAWNATTGRLSLAFYKSIRESLVPFHNQTAYEARRAAQALPGAETYEMGRFDMVQVTRR
jgi:hypothetical protein